MLKKQLLATLAVLSVVAAGLGLAMAGAGADPSTYNDPHANDQSIDARVRIQQVSANAGQTLTLSMVIANATDPTSDPNWRDPHLTVNGWAIFENGSTSVSYAVSAAAPQGTYEGAVVRHSDHTVTCHGSQVQVSFNSAARQYSASFDPSCIGNPSTAEFAAVALYDPTGDQSQEVDDVSPSGPPPCCQVSFGSSGATTSTTQPGGTTTTTVTGGASKQITRLAGNSRDETAIQVSKASFPNSQSAQAAVLVNQSSFADALAGTPLAVVKKGPLLLTPRDSLDSEVASELQRVLPQGATVYLLGGGFALSDNIATQVQGLGFNVVRYAGRNRFETATIIADQGLGNPSKLLEATGMDFADALAGGAEAAANNGAILLTNDSSQAPETLSYINAHTSAIRYALGGKAQAADPSAQAIVGRDRYETAVLVAKAFFSNPTIIGVASGVTFPDALAGGAHIATQKGPMILVPRTGALPSWTTDYLTSIKGSVTGGFAYGGGFALGTDVVSEVQQAISS